MKNISIIICLILSNFVYSQKKEVYEVNEYGLKELTPTYKVEDEKVYEYNEYGLKNISPSIKVEDDKVYKVNEYGLKELFPEYELDIEE